MNINEIKGDLLQFPENINILAHAANVRSTFGSGIAAQIRKQIPEMRLADDRFYIPVGKKRLGHCSMAYFERDGVHRMGFNLYGQDIGGYDKDGNRIESLSKYGIPTDYDALLGALYGMRRILCISLMFNILDDGDPVKIGFPYRMASDLGGGDFDKVLELIKTVFRHYNVDIYIVDFNE